MILMNKIIWYFDVKSKKAEEGEQAQSQQSLKNTKTREEVK